MPEPEVDPTIRPVRVEDAEAVNRIRRDPSVIAGTTALPSETVEENRAFLQGLGEDDHVVVVEVDGELVGMGGLHGKPGKLRHTTSIGLLVEEPHQGKGIGRALMHHLLDLAFRDLGYHRVELSVFADNDRAIALYEKLGFEHEGREREKVWKDGAYVDLVKMGILEEEWLSGSG